MTGWWSPRPARCDLHPASSSRPSPTGAQRRAVQRRRTSNGGTSSGRFDKTHATTGKPRLAALNLLTAGCPRLLRWQPPSKPVRKPAGHRAGKRGSRRKIELHLHDFRAIPGQESKGAWTAAVWIGRRRFFFFSERGVEIPADVAEMGVK